MAQESVGVFVDANPPGRHMRFDFLLPLLPTVLPKPALISRDRQHWPKFQHPVRALGDLYLSPRLVKM